MSVLISDMNVPTSCGECKAFVCYKQWAGDVGDCFCGITKNDAEAKTKNADCSLVPIPPHGDLIDRDALEVVVEAHYKHLKISQYDMDLLLHYLDVEMAPTIISAEEGE